MSMNILLTMIVTTSILGGAATVRADTATDVDRDCGGCHQLKGPARDSLKERRARKGPPLYYAGNKFREEWLEQWLQEPTRIRPAGDFPATDGLTRMGEKGDVIDTSVLPEHLSVDDSTAKRYAAWLMTLKPHDDLIAAEKNYQPGRISPRMGAMNFVKFKGCGACHKDTPKYGGVSGPALYAAWRRLQPEYIISYIRNPTAWEPISIMPVKHLKTSQIYKLADYLHVLDKQGD